MEDKKDSKTLEVKSKLSHSQNPCGQIPDEDSVLSEFSKKCNGSVLGKNLQIDVNSVTVETSNVKGIRMANYGENGSVDFENNLEPFKGEDEMKRGFLGYDRENEFFVKCNKGSNFCDDSHIDVDLSVLDNDGVQVEMNTTEEVAEKTDDATQICMSDSTRKVDDISPFVDIFGPLDGIYEVEDGKFSNENVLEDGHSSENMSRARDGSLSSPNCRDANVEVSESLDFLIDLIDTDITDEANQPDGAMDETIENEEGNVILGDLVWIKTKTNLWWPGVVSDPSNATKDVGSNKKGSVLVKYFGNANFVWCFPSNLKHFVQCFDEMVQQNSSRSFCGAVERAVNEIGRRIKEEMTCSCFSKEIGTEASVYTLNGNLGSKQKVGDLCDLSVSRFEPANFLAHIKCLAHDGSVPGKINLIAAQNRLTSFYRSLGHFQLPMNQLRPSDARESAPSGQAPDKEFVNQAELTEKKENCGGKVEIIIGYNMNSSEIANSGPIKSRRARGGSRVSGDNGGARTLRISDNGNKSRERKKSKYLSYPYIDPIKDKPTEVQNETEDPEKVSNAGKGSNSKNSQKRGPRKSSVGLNAICKPEDIKSSSSEMLSELHLTARDCSNYKERRSSASIKRFISCFRRFAFLNHEIAANKDIGDGLEFSHKDNSSRNLPKAQSQKQETNKRPEDVGEHPSSNGQPKKRRRKKKGAVISEGAVSLSTMTGAVNGLLGTDSGENPCSSGQPKKRRRKKKEAVTSEGAVSLSMTKDAVNGSLCADGTQTENVSSLTLFGVTDIKPTGQLPEINANGTNTSVERLTVLGNSASQGKRGRKKRKVEESPTKNGLGWMDLHGKCVKFVDLLKDVQKVGPNVQLLKDVQMAGPGSFTSILDRNNMVPETEVASEITDRQADAVSNHVKSSSVVQNLQQTQILDAAGNPEKKRRRRRKKASDVGNNEGNSCIPDLNGNVGESGSGANDVTDMNSLPNNEKPWRRRRRNKSDATVPDKAQNNVELSGAILLYFASGVSLPSVESLLTTFVGYGALIESETRHVDDSTAQVMFVQSSDALRAFRSFQENNPLGPSLASSRLVYLSAPRSSSIPDLNGKVPESGSKGNDVGDINSLPNKDKPGKRRRRNKVQNEEISGAILLNFVPGVALPSVESLLTTFMGYGAIKESETRYVNDSTAQVVFVQTSYALQAYQSLQGNNPFGSALAGCRFIYLSAPKPAKSLQTPQPCLPMNGNKAPAIPSSLTPKTGDPPDLLTIKQNLEMMKSMLEKAGNNLSPEMRTKLESEIKGLMLKVNSTVGSSST